MGEEGLKEKGILYRDRDVRKRVGMRIVYIFFVLLFYGFYLENIILGGE